MKPDIRNRQDIILLIDRFYERVRLDPVIGYIFTDVAKVDWEKHLPVMYDFWTSLLLDEQSYIGNPMLKHISLNKLAPLGSNEFSTWLTHFKNTVGELFEGPKAEEAIARAEHIAALMEYKIRNSNGMGS